ncbi:excinuclease ABC subunit UvrA [Patescibacteria group bacterium]|nr:MAG: excinuclease ABC subunit UvrA [Patescibacteria group bacterium]
MSNIISIKGARVHNLKNISAQIPKEKLTVITGLSGSGKSSLAFDTIFAEGQRRYMESLSAYARQFLELQDRPDVDEITGLSPTIAIDQKSVSRNPRSTVGTITEIYDHLRLLFARAGRVHCPRCREPVAKQTLEEIGRRLIDLTKNREVRVLSPIVRDSRGEHRTVLLELDKAGYKEIRLDGELLYIEEALDRRLDKTKKHSIDAVTLVLPANAATQLEEIKKRLETALDLGNGYISAALAEKEILFSTEYACAQCGLSLPAVEPRLFSFNSPHGACPACNGLGITLSVLPELVVTNPRLTIAEGAIKPWRMAGTNGVQMKLVEEVGQAHGFDLNTPFGKLAPEAKKIIFYGAGEETFGPKNEKYEGVIPSLEQKYRGTDSEYLRKEIRAYMQERVCQVCLGKRLRPEALAVTLQDKSIADIAGQSVEEALQWIDSLLGKEKNGLNPRQNGKKLAAAGQTLDEDQKKIALVVLKEVRERLLNLVNVGVEYLALDRSAATLSGGEAQRVRLATQLASDLSGVIYILDEPSIGLHGRDNQKLIETMKRLRDAGNTVIVVEHDAQTIRAADYVIDVGPGAGEYGGEIIAAGTAATLCRKRESITGLYLSGKREIPAPKLYRRGNRKLLTIVGPKAYNLKGEDIKIPLGQLVCVTGVSGSGKSTLILDILGKALAAHYHGARELPAEHKTIKGVENLDKVIMIDQSPIGKTPRSNPATYTQLFTAIRDLYTEIPEAKMRGYNAGMFSFNVTDGGRCGGCDGEGFVKIDMQFLPNVYIECKECRGTRYRAEALEIHYKGKTIADVLAMTVEEARNFFADQSAIADKLELLRLVGLGYMRLGQPATTLSGGEAQRVKLATELSRRATGKTLYILDEPTTGLHFEDIGKLLKVIHELVNKGNSVIIIEHNLDVIKSADFVIDLGPGGGKHGGWLVAAGTPREVAKAKNSATGQLLKTVLK